MDPKVELLEPELKVLLPTAVVEVALLLHRVVEVAAVALHYRLPPPCLHHQCPLQLVPAFGPAAGLPAGPVPGTLNRQAVELYIAVLVR